MAKSHCCGPSKEFSYKQNVNRHACIRVNQCVIISLSIFIVFRLEVHSSSHLLPHVNHKVGMSV